MLKLLPVSSTSFVVADICYLITRYGGIIFSEFENPVSVFLNNLADGKSVTVAAFKNDIFFAFVTFYNFKKISKKYFSCYMYGASERAFAKEIEIIFDYFFYDLKIQGCKVVRCETREYNMPMRKLAARLGFEKTGFLRCTEFRKGKFKNTILYEKILQ